MANDSQDLSRRKHRRSDDGESEETSRRRKHQRSDDDEAEERSKRHKHRHHHHHHRHNHGHHHRHGSKKDREDESKNEEEINPKNDESKGEVGGEEKVIPPLVCPVLVSNSRPDYDMEEGEIVEDGEFHYYNTEVHEAQEGQELCPGLSSENAQTANRNSMILQEDNGDDNLMTKTSVDWKENMSDASKAHEDVDSKISPGSMDAERKYHTADDMLHRGDEFLIEESGKLTSYYNEEDDLRDHRTFSSMDNELKRHKTLPRSPSSERHHSRNRSWSCDRARERSQSQSILPEASFVQSADKEDGAYHTDRKHRTDSEDERTIGYGRDYWHGSRDLSREKEIERGSSYSRYIVVAGRHGQETWDRDRVGSREIRDRDREGKEMNKDRRREAEQDRDLERDRERDRARDRERERVRRRERERRRERNGNRDRDWEKENERVTRHRKYDDNDSGYGDRDKNNDSRYRRHEEKYKSDKVLKNDPEKVRSSKNVTAEVAEEKHGRGEDEQEDFQENIALQPAEQEEEDLNRIKEESRRRRQAILEKYKVQQFQQQHKPYSNDTVEEHAEQHSDQVAAANVVSDVGGVQNEGADIYAVDLSFSLGKSPPQTGLSAIERTSGTRGLGDGTPKSEKSDDMFCDDIFGESPAGVRKSGKGDGLAIERSGLHDNWDDAEGYYSYRFGEILDGRYEVTAAHGKGVFSTVVRAKDLKAGPGDPEEVAIKIIRNNDTMYKAGLEELVILKKLVGADPENKRHCVLFISSFKYRNHLCLVFESLHMNLREVLKKFGRNIGLRLTAVRAYAKQLFIALKHLRNCGVLHCDIKPDNMLYDHPMDMWSVGCCLFELYTGKVLFPGPTNNEMLRLHMELKGPFPKKMLRKGSFTDQHFDQDLNFLATEEDPVTKKTIKRLILNIKPKDVGTLISGSPGEDPKMLANFKDLLEKIFVLDPDKRITVSQALSHPFITGK